CRQRARYSGDERHEGCCNAQSADPPVLGAIVSTSHASSSAKRSRDRDSTALTQNERIKRGVLTSRSAAQRSPKSPLAARLNEHMHIVCHILNTTLFICIHRTTCASVNHSSEVVHNLAYDLICIDAAGGVACIVKEEGGIRMRQR